WGGRFISEASEVLGGHSCGCAFRSPEKVKSQQLQLPRSGPDGQPIESSHLALLSRTIKTGPAGLHDSANAAGGLRIAIAAPAAQPRALIDAPATLEITKLAIGLHVVAQGGPACGDRFVQHGAHHPGKFFCSFALDGVG